MAHNVTSDSYLFLYLLIEETDRTVVQYHCNCLVFQYIAK